MLLGSLYATQVVYIKKARFKYGQVRSRGRGVKVREQGIDDGIMVREVGARVWVFWCTVVVVNWRRFGVYGVRLGWLEGAALGITEVDC